MPENERVEQIQDSESSYVDESLRDMAEDDLPANDAGMSDAWNRGHAANEKHETKEVESERQKEEAIERVRNGQSLDDLERELNNTQDDNRDSELPATDAGVDDDAIAVKDDLRKFKIVDSGKAATTEQAIASVMAQESDLVMRARQIKALNGFAWPVVETKSVGGMQLVKAVSCDQNRMYFMSVLFGEDPSKGRPHIDTFRGRFVDHRGVIVDDRYSMEPMIAAMKKAGLEAQPIIGVRNAFKEWAMKIKQNDLIVQFEKRVPEWDGTPRMEMRLIKLLESSDTPLNREFGKYFWLSIYNRVTSPGCLAPIVLSMFGAQNAGKSRFSNEIVRAVLGNREVSSVQLDLSANSLDFLREITGNSVVANIGEMTGFTRGDLNKIKDFVTRTSDKMHYKYEGHFEQQRQWVSILDGNKYEGLQRDDTGNRRFYPMFLGQLPDKDGKPHWKDGFEIEFEGFEDLFWQIMAECSDWMEKNGMKAYETMGRATAKKVFEFSAEEMKFGRGTSHDHELDNWFTTTLRKCSKDVMTEWAKDEDGKTVKGADGKKVKGRTGIVVYREAFIEEWEKHCKKPLNHNHWEEYMNPLEGEKGRFTGNRPGYFFPQYCDLKSFIAGAFPDDGVASHSKATFDEDGGF